MNLQRGMIDKETSRIAVFAVAAAAVLVLAAYAFGARMPAVTSTSVAPSALGSSVTAAREARAVAPSAANATNAAAAAKWASVAARDRQLANFYIAVNATNAKAAAAKWASVAARDESWARFYIALNRLNSKLRDAEVSPPEMVRRHE